MAEMNPDDGRHARRSKNRSKIIHAFKELVRDGQASPTAKEVALRAGVGLRTVYRCFDDMGSLYQELVQDLHGEFLPRAALDLDTGDRALRLERLLTNRSAVFGDMEPFLLASEVKRHVYKTLAEDYAYLLTMERERLAFVVNPDETLPIEMVEALNAVTGFSFWRRLRIEQGLDREMAGRVMSRTAHAILASQRDLPPVPSQFRLSET